MDLDAAATSWLPWLVLFGGGALIQWFLSERRRR